MYKNLTHFTRHHHYHRRMTRGIVLDHHVDNALIGCGCLNIAKITHIQFRLRTLSLWPWRDGVYATHTRARTYMSSVWPNHVSRTATQIIIMKYIYMSESILIIASNWGPKWNKLKTPPTITHRVYEILNKTYTLLASATASAEKQKKQETAIDSKATCKNREKKNGDKNASSNTSFTQAKDTNSHTATTDPCSFIHSLPMQVYWHF